MMRALLLTHRCKLHSTFRVVCFHYQVTYSNNNNDRSLQTRFCDLEIFIFIIIKSDNNKAKFNIQGS